MVEALVTFLIRARDFIGIPQDITLWDLANSELMIALSAAGLGWFVNRKFNRMDEKQEAREEERTLERDMRLDEAAEMDAPDWDDLGVDLPPAPTPPSAGAPQAPDATPKPKRRLPFSIRRGASAPADPHFERGQMLVQQLKDEVDKHVETVRDGRKRRKYRTIGKRDYRLRVEALLRDGELSSDTADLMRLGLDIWRPFQTRKRDVPEAVIMQLEQILRALHTQTELETQAQRRRRKRRG